MSVDDGLRAELDRTFGTFSPHPAPVEQTMRRGRAIRRRRWLAAASTVAVLIAAGSAVAAWAPWRTAPQPAPASGRVTVQPPAANAPAGEVASGTIDGKQWWLTAELPGTEGAPHGQEVIVASGPAMGASPLDAIVTVPQPSGTDPAALGALSSGGTQIQYGGVTAEVTHLVAGLSNGQTLTLLPVTVYGTRMVAFAAPLGTSITQVTAFSAHGELASAVPFSVPGSFSMVGAWLAPGQHGLSRASGQVGSGTYQGKHWSVTADVGPWGVCVLADGDSEVSGCIPTTTGLGTGVLSLPAATPEVAFGMAAASVTRVTVHRPDGSTVQVRPVTVGKQKLFAVAMKAGPHKLTWTAYGASGAVVASGGT